MPSTTRRTIGIYRALAMVFILAHARTYAQDATMYDLPAQPLVDSLKAIANQSNTNVLFDRKLVEGLRAPPIKARLTPEAAISKLLEGSALTHELINEHTIVLASADASSAKRSTHSAERTRSSTPAPAADSTTTDAKEKSFWDRFRLAQVDDRSSLSGNSSTEEPADGPVQLGEVIVTAQKRAERLIDVPISIVALSAEELRERKVTSLEDLALVAPGLSVQSSGGHQRRIMLRGTSNFVGNSSLVGLYLDEASVTSDPTSQLDLRTYDLDRVEVLRGPQGTLYGEGSVGGTVRFITKDPVLDRLAARANVQALFTQDGEPGQRIDAMVNVPLIENQMGLRIAGTFDRESGWVDQPAAGRQDFNGQNLADVRVKGLWQPSSQFSASAMALIHRNDGAPNVGEDENGNFTQVFNLAAVPSLRDDYDIFNVTLRYELASVQLLSTTSYVEQDKDTHNFGFQLPLAAPPAQPFDVLSPSAKLDAHNFTEELRFQSLGSHPLQWSVGAFYRRARFEFDTSSIFGLAGAPGTPLPAPFLAQVISETNSWAAFGDAHYALTERFTLGVGLRYFEDDEDYTFGTVQSGTFHALSPRSYAQFRVSDTVNTYASAGKGFRSGGFNGLGQPPYDPENVWTYELGAKMSLAGGRVSVDTAVFYTDYEDYQIIGTVPLPGGGGLASITSNAGSAAVKGVEWALSWRPTSEWTLAFTGDYIHSEFYEINAADSSHEVGDRLDLSPKYSFVFSAQRNFTWGEKAGFGRVDYSQQGRSTFRNRNIAGPSPWYFSESDVINMLGVDLGLHWNDHLSLELFAQNLLNDRGFVDALSIQRGASRSRPRTYGVGFNVSFE